MGRHDAGGCALERRRVQDVRPDGWQVVGEEDLRVPQVVGARSPYRGVRFAVLRVDVEAGREPAHRGVRTLGPECVLDGEELADGLLGFR